MKWRVMVELAGAEGTVVLQEVSAGGSTTAECSAKEACAWLRTLD
jgi:hypothetical protein